jgi:DNA polymerase phi
MDFWGLWPRFHSLWVQGSDVRDALLGRVFGCAAVVRSGRVGGDGVAAQLATQLVSLAQRKSFLTEACATVLLELTGKHSDAATGRQTAASWASTGADSAAACALCMRWGNESAIRGNMLLACDFGFRREHVATSGLICGVPPCHRCPGRCAAARTGGRRPAVGAMAVPASR